MESLGSVLIFVTVNPRLVYGRMTDGGKMDPFKTAGHDINYIVLTGALNAMQEDSSQTHH